MEPLIIEVTKDVLKGLDQLKIPYNIKNENNSQSQTYIPKPNIIKSDYIKLGIENIEKNFDENKGFDIAICKSEFSRDHEEQNISLLEKGLYMSNIKEFMIFHNSIMDTYKNNTQLFNAEGNKIPSKVIKDIYNQLTRDEWTNLNAKFEKDNSGDWIAKEAVRLDESKNIIYNSRKVIVPITEDCYVDPKTLNEDSFPTEKSKKQKFKRGENIYFWSPRDGAVAGFSAGGDGASLSCYWSPSNRYSVLGVHAVRKV